MFPWLYQESRYPRTRAVDTSVLRIKNVMGSERIFSRICLLSLSLNPGLPFKIEVLLEERLRPKQIKDSK